MDSFYVPKAYLTSLMENLKSKMLLAKPEPSLLPLSLSVSKVKTFKDCKAKFQYCYIEKLPRKEWDFHVFGKFLHEVLENFYKQIINGSPEPPNVIMTACFKAAFEAWKVKLTTEQVKEAKQILVMHLKQSADKSQVGKAPTYLSVEKEFYIDIDGKILLNGFIDRIQLDTDGVVHVSDYKTTKNKKYLKNDYFQLLTYAFVMCLEDPSIQKVRTSYILLRHNFESIVKEFDRAEIMKVEQIFLDYANQIDIEKLYRPNPSRLCNYCDYLDHCDAGRKITNYDETHETPYGAIKW